MLVGREMEIKDDLTWGRTYSRVQNASLVPAFQNSNLQANASVEIIV